MTYDVTTWAILAMLTGLLLVSGTEPAAAQARCAQDLRDCYIRASHIRYWGEMWLAGIDCELDFVDCARRKIIGR